MINKSESRREPDTLEADYVNEELEILHIRAKSSREYRCDVCTAAFSSKRSVCEHMEKSHREDAVQKKSYKCAECEKLFRVKCSLTIHMRTHTGERPYQCKVRSRVEEKNR